MLQIIKDDSWLEPVAEKIEQRHRNYLNSLEYINNTSGSLINHAKRDEYLGFHYDFTYHGWWYREWLPAAHEVYLMGDFNDWQRFQLPLDRERDGIWSIFLSDSQFPGFKHETLVKIVVKGENGTHERIPAYIKRVIQDDTTKDFTGQIWQPSKEFSWRGDKFKFKKDTTPLIYEAHIGMASERSEVASFKEFTANILPRVKQLGYNTIQLMAVAEHPYYGSFGYHVSNFFAVSSRYGTPEELKELVKTAHSMGIAIVMDLIHSHYVKNINEGINELDGSPALYSAEGERGDQPYWDSKNFDYEKIEVQRFLLSNLRYWIEEFHFDGFRFDGVTSMIYYHHGYTEFDDRDKFFNEDINLSAINYLTLANSLCHSLKKDFITISEDVSGMPGMCIDIKEGGIGFDYRLGMAIPDFWIRLLEDMQDTEWSMGEIWHIMTNRLSKVKTIAYAESHDQAIVGDKTIAFRLIDKYMYTDMDKTSKNLTVDRGIALHKIIRLATATMGGQGYLNFMGNEFGHPEWIDFPREGNDWSYDYARRQWSLSSNGFLRYSFLEAWDKKMIELLTLYPIINKEYPYLRNLDEQNQSISYSFGDKIVIVINFSPESSVAGYRVNVPCMGNYLTLFSSDEEEFGGFGRQKKGEEHFTFKSKDQDNPEYIEIYNTARTATVFIRKE
ncbi:MAG: alpha-amylase family glycosyl hydrolase [Rikenellaceae bacterium]